MRDHQPWCRETLASMRRSIRLAMADPMPSRAGAIVEAVPAPGATDLASPGPIGGGGALRAIALPQLQSFPIIVPRGADAVFPGGVTRAEKQAIRKNLYPGKRDKAPARHKRRK